MTNQIIGAKAVMESLLREQVDVIFGYPGGAIMPVYDALYDYRDQIKHILVRHEQAAGHAAQGYARMAGKPGVALVTSGPGATNMVTAIADAMMDSIPLVCISGQVAASLLGTDAFQETDFMGITTPITKWNYQITKASEIAETFAKAFYIAKTGRPGPVAIDITKSAQMELCRFVYPSQVTLPGYKQIPLLAAEKFKQAAALINSAKRPLLLVGHGVRISQAEKEVRMLAEKTGMPVATTLHGLSIFPTNHPLYMGMLGMHGNYAPNILTNSADVILAVGMRFDDRVTGRVSDYAKQAKIIHMDVDASEFNKIVQVDLPLHTDAKTGVIELLKYINSNSHEEWNGLFDKYRRSEFEKVIKQEIDPQSGEITMAEVVHTLSEFTNGEATVVADVGQHQMIAARYYEFTQPDGFLTSGGLGTMGYALPAAIGAKVGREKKTVVAIVGDGSFQMNIQELATLAQENISVKIIILNNNYLGMVRQWQELFFEKRYSFVDLQNPDFVAVAKGFFIPAEKVTQREELAEKLQAFLSSDGPAVLEVVVKKEQNVFPMMPTGAAVDEMRLE
jgi:acetolactate synthase-1/2/3 large subunit